MSHSVWLYFHFALSFHDVEEMLAMRNIVLSYPTIRECYGRDRLSASTQEPAANDFLSSEPLEMSNVLCQVQKVLSDM